MKIGVLILLISSLMINSHKLLSETSCEVSYIYYPIPADNVVTYTTSTSTSSYVVPTTTTTSVVVPYSTPTTVIVPLSSPIILYKATNGNQSWKLSVMNEEQEKIFRNKGEKYFPDKNNEKWFIHDKVDNNLKASFSKCQNLNWEIKSRKEGNRNQGYEDRVFKKIPEFLEKVEIKDTNSVKKEVKASTNQIQAANNPVTILKTADKARFLQKKQDIDDFEEGDNSLEKFEGNTSKAVVASGVSKEDKKAAKNELKEQKITKEAERLTKKAKSKKKNRESVASHNEPLDDDSLLEDVETEHDDEQDEKNDENSDEIDADDENVSEKANNSEEKEEEKENEEKEEEKEDNEDKE
jgi:hypothetical protein